MKIDMPSLRQLSFPDYRVRHFGYDIAERHAAVAMEGAWLGDGAGREVGSGWLTIDGWLSVQVSTYDPQSNKWSAAISPEPLKDICEAEFEAERVVLRGFSSISGLWTEFVFLGALASYNTDA